MVGSGVRGKGRKDIEPASPRGKRRRKKGKSKLFFRGRGKEGNLTTLDQFRFLGKKEKDLYRNVP